MNFAELDACVRRLRNDMIDFTSELVAIASENPPGSHYPECVRAIESRLRALDLPCEVVKYRPRKGVLGRIRGRRRPEQRRHWRAGALLLGPLRCGAGDHAGSVHACAPRQHAVRARVRGHEERPGLHAVRGGGPATTARAVERAARPRVRARRRNGRSSRLGVPCGREAPGDEWHRDAHTGTHQRRRVEREPGRAHHARDRARTRGACRTAAPGAERVRGGHPRRRPASSGWRDGSDGVGRASA